MIKIVLGITLSILALGKGVYAEEMENKISGRLTIKKEIFDNISVVADTELSASMQRGTLGIGLHGFETSLNLEIGAEKEESTFMPIFLGEVSHEFSFEENEGAFKVIEIFLESEVAQKKEFLIEKSGILLGFNSLPQTKIGLIQTYFWGQHFIGFGPMIEVSFWGQKISVEDSFSPSGQMFLARTQMAF